MTLALEESGRARHLRRSSSIRIWLHSWQKLKLLRAHTLSITNCNNGHEVLAVTRRGREALKPVTHLKACVPSQPILLVHLRSISIIYFNLEIFLHIRISPAKASTEDIDMQTRCLAPLLRKRDEWKSLSLEESRLRNRNCLHLSGKGAARNGCDLQKNGGVETLAGQKTQRLWMRVGSALYSERSKVFQLKNPWYKV